MRAPWIETVVRHWRHGRIVRRRAGERHPGIVAALRAATPDSVLLAGNSHAEFIGSPDLGGRPCINLAVGGSTAADCARHLADLRLPVRCAAAILIIGTNDLQRWRHPERLRTRDRFEVEARRILRILDRWSAQVFVAAVPPIGTEATGRDPAAVAAFSARLAGLCVAEGHAFVDPFARWRAGTGGLAGAGLHRDGVHLADYAPLAEAVARLVALGPEPPAGRPWCPAAPIPVAPAAASAMAPAIATAATLRVLRAAWIGRL
ncbi:SGNH/GDSL hydrolase family protein [Methylobacterium mesophilicum SR1.6/6]|uniref:SGNH/GDSL hydrolase family protein n=1 Tax=Methylobacterium mesophilicum SR1.6/6 TaxID=908290 RepID=A0A6B9FNN5_9HYPH|nr:SGNH/GDSL hydrolase family protein [Methylobacterium mesophilicum]QGY03469.1 SGNH/GDSL hydrolase family protein [Methylobacterium mesophilicum SR1.6/6]